MDVTSLLNASSAANLQRRGSIDQTPTPSATGGTTASSTAVPTPSPENTPSRRTSVAGSRSPNRNRTPWDAGGYSLPLTLDTKSFIQNPAAARPNFYSESPVDCLNSASPNSPRHKFSDSRSSLSSYTSSSNNSVSHSRISSLSTVSEFQPLAATSALLTNSNIVTNADFQPLANLLTDITLDPRMSADQAAVLEAAAAASAIGVVGKDCPVMGTVQPPSPTIATSSIQVAHSRSASRGSSSLSSGGDAEPLMQEDMLSRRPGSPSDAVMIPRGQNGQSNAASPTNISQDELNNLLSPESSPSRAHKRSVSAPDFAGTVPQGDRRHGLTGNNIEVRPAPAPRTSGETVDPAGDMSEDPEAFLDDPVVRCMYTNNCDTNSQPRKAISHIFGRNKLCTRSIPDHVWVHYCRKHYQRSRYRNAQEYAKTQCELVSKQVGRVQAWSDRNERLGKQGVVQNWSLSIRKREQKRIDDKNANKKRKFRDDDDDEDDEDESNDRAIASGTAVPQWLLSRCGQGYSTNEINNIVTQLRVEMDEGRLNQIPDIEILPNVITDNSDENKSKPYPKRKTSTSTHHKRSQSVGVSGLRPQLADPYPGNFTRRLTAAQVNPITSAAAYWGQEDTTYGAVGMPSQKRARMGEQDDYYSRGSLLPSMPGMPPRNMERTVPTIRRIGHQQITQHHRPSFPDIHEGHVDERYYNDRQLQTSQPTAAGNPYAFTGAATVPGSHGPLPAPTPQRHAGTPMAEQLESTGQPTTHSGYQEVRPRPTHHQRSYSDASSVYNHSQFGGYGRPSSAGYSNGGTPNGYATQSAYTTAPMSAQTPGYDTTGTPGAYSLADYMRPESTNAWGSEAQGPPGYYDDIAPRQAGPPSFYSTTPAAPSPAPSVGAVKHMRHQSQPVMPRMLQRTFSTSSPSGQNQYSLAMQGTNYASMHPSYDQTQPTQTVGGYHMRNQSFTGGMPRVDEMDPSRDYLRR